MCFLIHSGNELIRVSKTIPRRQYLYAVDVKLTTKPDNIMNTWFLKFIFSEYWNLIVDSKPLFIFIHRITWDISYNDACPQSWLVSPNQFIHYRQWELPKPLQNKNESKQCPLMVGILRVVGIHTICCSYLCVVFWCKGKLGLLPSRWIQDPMG